MKRRSKGHYKIEKDVPIPSPWRTDAEDSPRTQALLRLKVGQSIFCPEFRSVGSVGHVRNVMKRLCDFTFVSRAVKGGGVRIWRVK